MTQLQKFKHIMTDEVMEFHTKSFDEWSSIFIFIIVCLAFLNDFVYVSYKVAYLVLSIYSDCE
jgi:hypothetical protein